LLEQGDIDIARNVGAEEIAALSDQCRTSSLKVVLRDRSITSASTRRTRIWPSLQVRQAMKYLVDYATIADTIMKGKVVPHQAFLPRGFLGALEETPFSLNVEKAKELLG
jgi:peptide/nickel transport system substrate-binding protein